MNSSERITEIPVESEADLDKIRGRKLSEDIARFVNFMIEGQSLVGADCLCANSACYAFIVYDSGRSVLEQSTLAGLVSMQNRLGDKIKYFRVFRYSEQSYKSYQPSPSTALREAVKLAQQDGFSLKNCYLCSYQGDNYTGGVSYPVYCKYFRKKCNSNEAVDCGAFNSRVAQSGR